MSARQWRWMLIAFWVALAGVIFLFIGSTSVRAMAVLAVVGLVPPLMLLFLWTEDGPALQGRIGGDR